MFINLNLTDFRWKRHFEAGYRAKLPSLGCKSPPEGFGGRDDTNPTPPPPFVGSSSLPRELALAQVVPSRMLTPPGHGAPLAPAPQTQHRLPDTPKQLSPNLSPVPHLTWGHQTPLHGLVLPLGIHPRWVQLQLPHLSLYSRKKSIS